MAEAAIGGNSTISNTVSSTTVLGSYPLSVTSKLNSCNKLKLFQNKGLILCNNLINYKEGKNLKNYYE